MEDDLRPWAALALCAALGLDVDQLGEAHRAIGATDVAREAHASVISWLRAIPGPAMDAYLAWLVTQVDGPAGSGPA